MWIIGKILLWIKYIFFKIIEWVPASIITRNYFRIQILSPVACSLHAQTSSSHISCTQIKCGHLMQHFFSPSSPLKIMTLDTHFNHMRLLFQLSWCKNVLPVWLLFELLSYRNAHQVFLVMTPHIGFRWKRCSRPSTVPQRWKWHPASGKSETSGSNWPGRTLRGHSSSSPAWPTLVPQRSITCNFAFEKLGMVVELI